MKTILVFCISILLCAISLEAQVTQINANHSLHTRIPLNSTKTIAVSDIDSSIWVTDGSLTGTVQVSFIKFEGIATLLSGKVIFKGSTAATGSEIYVTDGTPAGTMLVKDIYSGTTGSDPGEMVLLNGFIYFTANTLAEGRELWRTNGTPGGTTIVKDIVTGPGSSNNINGYNLFSTGTYLLFAAQTSINGIELWKSDGTAPGTFMLQDINPTNSGMDSSNPSSFFLLNNIVLFTANDGTHGTELWKTDGTPGGTTLLKDINTGTASSTEMELFPGFSFPVFQSFHVFNNKAYFNAYDGTSTGEVWSTDGTTANTLLLKNIVPGTSISLVSVVQSVNYPDKFIFPVSNLLDRSELWQSDGTPGGTVLFKAFTPINPESVPFIFVPYSLNSGGGFLTQTLFQANKFFFTAGTTTEGYELWISDGSLAGTHIVRDINTGTADGIDLTKGLSYVYTSSALFFGATTISMGNELWKTDGTNANTALVQDIYLNTGDADPELPFVLFNNKIIFSATDGDDALHTDLYAVDGTFLPLPVKLTDFTVTPKAADALLQWNTMQEINSKDFTIERSYDGKSFDPIGKVAAAGNSSNRHAYSFTDIGIGKSGKTIVYYRLLSSDLDGKTAYSNVISLRLKGNSNLDVRLLSNPVKNDLQIVLSGAKGITQILIRDLSGKTIYKNNIENENGQITVPANVQAGVYVLTVRSNNEQKTVQFVKE